MGSILGTILDKGGVRSGWLHDRLVVVIPDLFAWTAILVVLLGKCAGIAVGPWTRVQPTQVALVVEFEILT